MTVNGYFINDYRLHFIWTLFILSDLMVLWIFFPEKYLCLRLRLNWYLTYIFLTSPAISLLNARWSFNEFCWKVTVAFYSWCYCRAALWHLPGNLIPFPLPNSFILSFLSAAGSNTRQKIVYVDGIQGLQFWRQFSFFYSAVQFDGRRRVWQKRRCWVLLETFLISVGAVALI